MTFNLGKTLFNAGERQAGQRILLRSLQVAHVAQILSDEMNDLRRLTGAAASTPPISDRYRWVSLVAQHPVRTAEELCLVGNKPLFVTYASSA